MHTLDEKKCNWVFKSENKRDSRKNGPSRVIKHRYENNVWLRKSASWRISGAGRMLEGKQPFSPSPARLDGAPVSPRTFHLIFSSQRGLKAGSSHVYLRHYVVCTDNMGFKVFKILLSCYNTGKPILITWHFCRFTFFSCLLSQVNSFKPWPHTQKSCLLDFSKNLKTPIVTETHLSSMNSITSWQ